jgi:hypothetical protein
LAAARRLKQSGVEIYAYVDDRFSSYDQTFWTEFASPKAVVSRNTADALVLAYHYIYGTPLELSSPGTFCTITGIPRVTTFDGNSFIFNGLGVYYIYK